MSTNNPKWRVPEEPLTGDDIRIEGWHVGPTISRDQTKWILEADIVKRLEPDKRLYLAVIHDAQPPLADYIKNPEAETTFVGQIEQILSEAIDPRSPRGRISPDFSSIRIPKVYDSYTVKIFTQPARQQE